METLPRIVVCTKHVETSLWVIFSKQYINYLYGTYIRLDVGINLEMA